MLCIWFAFFSFFQLNNQTVGYQILATLFILCGKKRKQHPQIQKLWHSKHWVCFSPKELPHVWQDPEIWDPLSLFCFSSASRRFSPLGAELAQDGCFVLHQHDNIAALQPQCTNLCLSDQNKKESEGPCRTKWHDPPDLSMDFKFVWPAW